tara:strand:- start:473 stop:868 length:396 start_codon:yes stop_codon:yes gene_type:complete
VRLFAKILVIAMVIWLLSVVICGLLGVSIQFPFTILEEGEIAYHRWQTIRIALFLTVAYYGLQYVLGFTKEVYPINFVKVYIFNMCIVGLALFYRLNVEREEYLVLAFWLLFLVILNIATTNRYRRLFKKK